MKYNKRSRWRRLDNAALLFSAASNKKDPRVFRFYCELKERIVKEKLQSALEHTVEAYPVFLSVMRGGLFWHYLEQSTLKPFVREEYRDPCSRIYIKDKKSLLFEVTYYENRINFEVFHALTDGTGATEFLRELVRQYLLAVHGKSGLPDIPMIDENSTIADQENDGFSKYYSEAVRIDKIKKPKAFQIRKTGRDHGKLQISERTISVDSLRNRAKELGVSITVFLTAVYLYAVSQEMTWLQQKRPVILMVPVNLRKFFHSKSMLNFFGWIEPGFQFEGEQIEFEAVLDSVKNYFHEELTKEKVAARMNDLISLEKHLVLRFFPLLFKNWAISTGAKQSEKNVTAIFSNMSIVVMPEEYVPYIERFGVYTSTPKLELCMCSFEDKASFGFTSRFDSSNIQRNFYSILKEQGIASQQENPPYPQSDTPNLTGITVYKWFSFLCIAAAVVVAGVNVMFTPDSYWCLLAIGGVASVWSSLSVGYYKRQNLLKDAMWQLILITCGCLIWDALIGWSGWSIDYAFPAAGIGVLISMVVISKIQAHPAAEYMIYLLMAATYSCLIPFALLLAGVVKVPYPSVICSGIGFLVVIGLMIFRWKEFKEELEKNFHV